MYAGVGFANYVVGNAVSNFWKKEMGGKTSNKMSDPFAGFLLKKKGQASSKDDSSDDSQDDGSDQSGEVRDSASNLA